MNDELIEQVARAVCCARARCEGCKGSGEGGCFDLGLWDQEAKAAIAAMQPHIAAEREDAARRALEAAADTAAKYVVGKPLYRNDDHSKPKSPSLARVGTAKAIRAIDPGQFREAGNG